MNEPPRRHDRAALAVLGGAAVLLVAAILYFVFADSSTHEKAGSSPLAEVQAAAARFARSVGAMFDSATELAGAPPTEKPPAQVPGPARIEAGRVWRYNVRIEPEVWRDVTLTYQSVANANEIAVQTEFRHAAGKTDFRLGTFLPDHRSHAQLRFPGFFMHAAYLVLPLEQGTPVEWGWAWQLPDNSVRDGRLKRYRGVVAGWETVAVPAGRFRAARIDADLYYVDEGKIQASAKEVLWYAPEVNQFVKTVREGRTPDERGTRIVAELAEYR